MHLPGSGVVFKPCHIRPVLTAHHISLNPCSGLQSSVSSPYPQPLPCCLQTSRWSRWGGMLVNQRESAGKWSQQMEQNRFSWQLLMQAFRGVFMNKENNSVLELKNVKCPYVRCHLHMRVWERQRDKSSWDFLVTMLSWNFERKRSQREQIFKN